MKLKKHQSNESEPQKIELRTDSGDPMGVVYHDGIFIPCEVVELSKYELKQIISVINNFELYFNTES